MQTRTFVSHLLVVLTIIVLAWLGNRSSVATGATNAGPDLTVEISIDPAASEINQEITIILTVKNIGDTAAAPSTVHLYVDPPQQPPTIGTTGRPFSVPGIPAGGSFSASRKDTYFTTEGCDHVIYAWIDRDGEVSEGDETNNLISLPVCVGVECDPDALENDNTNDNAQWLTENAAQAHTLCHPTNVELADIDTVKFTVFTGVTYTLATSNVGVHAAPEIVLGDGCGVLENSTTGALSWNSPSSAVCYATVAQEGVPLGPLSAYSLTLSSSTGITDLYEPDNQCANARDITTDGVRQPHLFQSPADQDWVKFTVEAGNSFIALADNAATGIAPIVTLFNSCNQVPANNSLAASAQQVAYNSTTDQIYYARIMNQDPAKFGADASYEFSVTASECQEDALEQDDNPTQAKTVTVGAAPQTRSFCPATDEDWVKFTAEKDKIYVLQTSNLAFASDTVITLFNTDGISQLAQNDDYGYTAASRIIWEAPANGVYFARIRHVDIIASGPNTQYDFAILAGFCAPDDPEGSGGDNGPGDAPMLDTDGSKQAHNFCADPLRVDLGDQDWVQFQAVAGGNYQIFTSNLGNNSDTKLELYASDGATLLQSNDDLGEGRIAGLSYTPTVSGNYFVRVTQFNSTVNGAETDYEMSIFGSLPPTPTFTPTPSPTPTNTPVPTSTPDPSNIQTLILTNKARVTTIYGASPANQLMTKLFALADDDDVNGLVVQVENDPAVAAAYAAWTLDAVTLADNDKANAVIAAIRNRVLSFAGSMPELAYIVIAGDDRIIPFRRVLDRVAPTGPSAASIEANYAPDVVENGSVKAALAANMVLTDDYVGDKEPSEWQDKQNNSYELYVSDYATGRLVENPASIIAFIDNYLGGDKQIETSEVLITGYDFLQDSANVIKALYNADALPPNSDFVAPFWTGAAYRDVYLPASPRFDIFSVNGHSSHIAQGAPNEDVVDNSGIGTTASMIAGATTDLTGALVYSAGCHAGLNDPGVLDLPEAFMQKKANYVGNTGFGWGSSGVVYTEALMRNYSRELLRDTKAQIGTALVKAKKGYINQALSFGAFDAKILMQVTLYGLPMVSVTSGGALTDEDPFPSAERDYTPPTSFGALAQGSLGYQLPGSFGSFGANSGDQGSTFDLNEYTTVSAGEPVQPLYFSAAAAPAAGELRGVLFLGGVYSDVVAFDPVIARATNEYINDESEPAFSSESFYPPLPYTIRSGLNIPGVTDTVVMSLGQYQSNPAAQSAGTAQTGVNRIYDQMSFGTYYSDSPDRNAANISFVDGVLLGPAGTTAGQAQIKVETQDSSGINRVVVAYHQNEGQWESKDLAYDSATQKWGTIITGSIQTEFFVQVVDNAGNVAVNNNKGRNYRLSSPLELASGNPISDRIYLPSVER